ncbi:hypothetical protein DFH11DRAFT_1548302 [Phellopilus nigrolimitatus]|nr:hypothetical protein DFH11DRAFT_1548302 [Phellopilus nigrolimitatus]
MRTGEPEGWRLVLHESAETNDVEATFRVQGVLAKLDMKPVVKEFADDKWQSWTPMTFEGHRSFAASNRMLTPIWQCRNAESMPLPPAFDPRGVLSDLVDKGEGKFLPDNEIKLYENIGGRYKKVAPTRFRLGDIVESQISFVAIPSKDKKQHKMKIVLRALAIEDTTPTQAAAQKRMVALEKKRKRTPCDLGEGSGKRSTLVRLTGYGEDEEDHVKTTRSRLDDMRIDQ